MRLLAALAIVGLAGAFGGLVSSLLAHDGLMLPKRERIGGAKVLRLGFMGRVIVGAFAAICSWGLYGPFSGSAVLGDQTHASPIVLVLGALVGAGLVGFAGPQWLTAESEKQVLKFSVEKLARAPERARGVLMTASPFDTARQLDT
jgi:hypothetical protein